MEQKKLLWIISAVGAFLLVIFVTAMIVYKPTQTIATPIPVEQPQNSSGWIPEPENKDTISTNDLSGISDTIETTTKQDEPQITETNPSESVNVSDLFVVSENTNVVTLGELTSEGTTIDLNSLKNKTQEIVPTNQNINITVTIPEGESKVTQTQGNTTVTAITVPATKSDKTEVVRTPAEPVIDYSKGAAEAEKAEKAAAVKKPTESATTTTKTTTATTTKPTAATKPATSSTTKPASSSSTTTTKPATSTTTTTSTTKPAVTTNTNTKTEEAVVRYWVQVASYSTKKSAEYARGLLSENKIESDIFTYTSSDKIYYRVRVGPYTTKSEASFWMDEITKIKDFKDSGAFVTKTTN